MPVQVPGRPVRVCPFRAAPVIVGGWAATGAGGSGTTVADGVERTGACVASGLLAVTSAWMRKPTSDAVSL